MRVTQGLRTFEEQDQLYAQGRTIPGKRVTNVQGGYSWHNYGLAYDVVPLESGKVDWDSKDWNKIGEIGKQNGLIWGGDWIKLVDRPHFEWHPGLTIPNAKSTYFVNRKLLDVWSELA